MKKSNMYTVAEVKALSLTGLQKAARELKVSHSSGMKQGTLLTKVIKVIDLQPKPNKLPILESLTAEIKNAENIKTLKEYAVLQNVKLKSTATRQDYIDALLVSIQPIPKLQTATAPPTVGGAVKLSELKEGSKFSFIRAGKVCKAVYTLVRKNATEAVSSDNGVEWTAKILGYNVMPIAQ